MTVRSGLDRLAFDNCGRLHGLRVGLVTHPAAVDAQLRSAAEILFAATNVELVALFGPEHGLAGFAQDLEGVPTETGPFPGIRVHSLYGATVDTLRPSPAMLDGLDALVIDLVDVGARYYTFQATMLFCMEEAAKVGLQVIVLDRPNPLGGTVVEGPTLRPGFESFVGVHPIATQHGLTLGELARLYQVERKIDVALEVFAVEGWQRWQDFPATELPWVLPSPNLPTFDSAVVYPGQCLIEGTNLSEGRGTTRPFELCAAPGVDANQLAKDLNNWKLPGVVFRPAYFKPTFQKHAGSICGGVQMHVVDRTSFQSVRTSLALLPAFRSAAPGFDWRRTEYEFVRDPIAIDLLFGSDRERLGLEAGVHWRDLAAAWEPEEQEFRERREAFLLY